MGLIEWKDEFELGINKIDRQHKNWMELINSLYQSFTIKSSIDIQKSILQDIIDYSKYHFAHEEKVMNEIGFDGLENQKISHQSITEKMERFLFEMERGNQPDKEFLSERLKEWSENHILEEDKKYLGKFNETFCITLA